MKLMHTQHAQLGSHFSSSVWPQYTKERSNRIKSFSRENGPAPCPGRSGQRRRIYVYSQVRRHRDRPASVIRPDGQTEDGTDLKPIQENFFPECVDKFLSKTCIDVVDVSG